MPRYIFVAGGVMSGVGKGVATASIGKILQGKGYKVSALKIDPYINVDAGTMNPLEHGEVFVTDDGTECDQDIGNYERFLNQSFATHNYLTTGRVYLAVINRERNLQYGGKCVEVVPHIPQEVIARIKEAGRRDKADFVLIEIGGTVGEYQNLLFLEAARMMKLSAPNDVVFVLVSYLPVPPMIGEMKTKPTQTAVHSLNAAGLQPDFIIARSELPIDKPRKRKIAMFCSVSPDNVIAAPDVTSIYEIPLNFEKENLGNKILHRFGLRQKKQDLRDWKGLVSSIKRAKKDVHIGIVGKYFETGDFTLLDSYISVIEAIKHASWKLGRTPRISWLSAEKYEKDRRATEELKRYDGIIVPGGFGTRGVEGKVRALEFCREHRIPCFGLCFGMQLAVIEFARNVCGLKLATSSEFVGKESPKNYDLVIDVMEQQKKVLKERRYGATMRLGAYACALLKGSVAQAAYGKPAASERHRHRYEVNNAYLERFEKKGYTASGKNPGSKLVEIMELKNHPFYLGTQFHPELKSRPLSPHPLFLAFLKACVREQKGSVSSLKRG